MVVMGRVQSVENVLKQSEQRRFYSLSNLIFSCKMFCYGVPTEHVCDIILILVGVNYTFVEWLMICYSFYMLTGLKANHNRLYTETNIRMKNDNNSG